MAFKYSTIFIVVVIILVGFAAYSSLFMDISLVPTYNITISTEFREAYTNLSALKGEVESATGLLTNMSEASDNATFVENDYTDPSKTQIKPVKMAKASFNIIKGFIFKTGDVLGIPPVITLITLLLSLIALVLAFIGLIFRYEP